MQASTAHQNWTKFDVRCDAGYPFGVMIFPRMVLTLSILTVSSAAWGQSVAFVAPGESPSSVTSRAVLRFYEVIEENENLDVLESTELRRALAGLPAESSAEDGDGEDDPLSDVRLLLTRATGSRERQNLSRIGNRVGVDLLVTVRQVGEELELRGFNVERSAYYQGTLMVPALTSADSNELVDFVSRRLIALRGSEAGEEESAGQPRRRRNRWWIWLIVGGAVAAAAVVGYLAQPDEVEDTGVTLRLTAP